jgi:hypothetical protein
MKGAETMKWETVEDIYADLMADAPKPPPTRSGSKISGEQRLVERRLPAEAVFQDAANVTDAALNRAEETMEQRRQKQIAKELAEHSAEGSAWHNLVQWRQSLDRAQERLRELDGEDPLTGNYDPIRRFEREMRGK